MSLIPGARGGHGSLSPTSFQPSSVLESAPLYIIFSNLAYNESSIGILQIFAFKTRAWERKAGCAAQRAREAAGAPRERSCRLAAILRAAPRWRLSESARSRGGLPTYIRRSASTAAEGGDSPRRDAVTLEGEGALEERVHLASRRWRLAALLEPRPCDAVRGALEGAARAYKRLTHCGAVHPILARSRTRRPCLRFRGHVRVGVCASGVSWIWRRGGEGREIEIDTKGGTWHQRGCAAASGKPLAERAMEPYAALSSTRIGSCPGFPDVMWVGESFPFRSTPILNLNGGAACIPGAHRRREPAPHPPELSELPGQVYLDLALEYIKSYPFSRAFQVPRKGRPSKKIHPNRDWQEKAREYLTACVNVDRSGLAAIVDSYNAEREQQRFVHVVFQRRWVLEELASEVMALVDLGAFLFYQSSCECLRLGKIRSETRTASDVATPSESGNKTIPEHVRDRDLRCRMTGISWAKWRMTEEDLLRTLAIYQAFELVAVLTGIKCDWTVDCVENALVLYCTIHNLFGAWKLYLEWTPDGKAIIRARSGTEFFLDDAQRRNCSQPGVLIDQPLKPPHDTNVNDIDRKYFVLHKFIGDIVWMSGVYDDDELEDEEDEEIYVTEDNIDLIMTKLSAPEMDLVPREREAMFGTRMVWVHKDKVWED
ncbi:hypothetical protein C8J57DRAFT_1616214 [Mycena rebaudengoi]|nr:hypothetical protein C8J57DRAFT_1616214 [Mycena rebaudengoi]